MCIKHESRREAVLRETKGTSQRDVGCWYREQAEGLYNGMHLSEGSAQLMSLRLPQNCSFAGLLSSSH